MFTFFAFKNFFTGLLPLVWHFGSAGVVVLALAGFYFAAPAWFMPGLRKIAPWIALAIVVYLVGLTIGVKDEYARSKARANAVEVHEAGVGDAIRKDAERTVPLVPAPAAGVPNHRLDAYDRGD